MNTQQSFQTYQRNLTSGAQLQVHMTGFRNDRGNASVALFASPVGFPDKPDTAVAGQLVRIENGKAVATFDALPPGTYAVAVLHDDNLSTKMETNFLGIPKKGFGMSRLPKKLFRAPTFQETAFEVGKGQARVEINMHYLL